MTNLTLGSNFDTSKTIGMRDMFQNCASLTSLNLGSKFNTSQVTTMSNMFQNCSSLTTLDLGPAFTNIGSTNTDLLTNCGKRGTIIYVPESIYGSRQSLKLNRTSTTTINYTTGTIKAKYKPEWEKVSSSINKTNKTMTVKIKGKVNEANYISTITNNLKETDIAVYINGTAANGITKTLSSATVNGNTVEYTITLSNFQQNQSGQKYKEWSGNVAIKIAGRGKDASTYSKNILVDKYGNQSMSESDETGTWIPIEIKDTDTNINKDGTMFADFIKPEIAKVSVTVDKATKTETIVFTAVDKYFKSSKINLSNIKVYVNGKLENAVEKTLTSVALTETRTVNGKSTTEQYGIKYTLTLSKFENITSYIDATQNTEISIKIDENMVEDNSGNTNEAITIKGETIDFVAPQIRYQYSSSDIDYTGKTVKIYFEILDINSASATQSENELLNSLDIKVGGETPDWSKVTRRIRQLDVEKSDGVSGVGYTVILSGLEQKQKNNSDNTLDYSGVVTIGIKAGIAQDNYGNKTIAKTITVGINEPKHTGSAVTVDVVDPIFEEVSVSADPSVPTATIAVKGTDKYYASNSLSANQIKVYVDGKETSGLTVTV